MQWECANTSAMLPAAAWLAARSRHQERVRPYTSARVQRAGIAQPHAVYDFLFTYYSFRPSHLERWSPGADVVIEDCDTAPLDWPNNTVRADGGWVIPSSRFPRHRVRYLEWCHHYLTSIMTRPPSFSCFGLHEWAMVYKAPEVRHSHVPLRVSPVQIADAVEGLGLRCSHYDAFRFFTPEAAPLNHEQLSRAATSQHDQRACIHVTMDLYKFAFTIAPWCSSDLVADAFLLAAEARRIDMRASPYDLEAMGFAPIKIETPEGRQEYLQEQRRLAELAVPVRARLLGTYQGLLADTRETSAATGSE